MIGQEYLAYIAQLLLQHDIVQSISKEMMQSAIHELRRHTSDPYLQKWESTASLLEVLVPFLQEAPLRFVWFDAEMDSLSYTELVGLFAEATRGEWVPQQVEYDITVDEGMDFYRIIVDISAHGEIVHGEWTTQSLGWIEDAFIDVIGSIARTYLLGEFIEIPMHDQSMLFIYLPKPLVRDLHTLLDQLEQEYPDFATFVQTFS